jgi:hypothetical protein
MRDVVYRPGYPNNPDWRASRAAELLLMGHSWKQVRAILGITKPEFDRVLDRAIEKARAEQKQIEHRFEAA